MNNLQKEIDKAFRALSAIPVSGDGVELMAMARDSLRTAYQLADTEKEKRDG